MTTIKQIKDEKKGYGALKCTDGTLRALCSNWCDECLVCDASSSLLLSELYNSFNTYCKASDNQSLCSKHVLSLLIQSHFTINKVNVRQKGRVRFFGLNFVNVPNK